MRAIAPDATACADEPIRVPGTIQPHGWMAILDASDGHLIAHSENWPGAPAFELALNDLRTGIAGLAQHEPATLLGFTHAGGQDWTCIAHNRWPLAILEFELAPPASLGVADALYTVAGSFAAALQRASSIQELATLAASQMKELSGFGRCLVYRFDPDGHGEVLAQAVDAGYDSYLGHRFPASDIPAQARELYVLNRFRLIADANASQVALRCVDPAWTRQTLDLSMAFLRSVSPVHLQYMRNMETLASMSVSIVVDGRLWGMISCHNQTPRCLSSDARDACEHLGRLLSMRIEGQEGRDEAAERLETRKLAFQVLSGLGRSDATLQQLLLKPDFLLRMVNATGVAVVHGQDCWSAGTVPRQDHLLALAHQISAARVHTFHVDRLANAYPPASSFPTVAAGVLAISISRVRTHVVLWFRPEVIETISWAGDPREPRGGAARPLSPRSSFSTWTQEVRGQSRRWSAADIACVAEIRHALITLVLTRAQEREALSDELARATRDIDSFTQSVSHELRQPVISAGSFGQLAKQQLEAAGDALGVGYMERVLKAIERVSAITDTLLELARISRATPQSSSVDVSALATQIAARLQLREPSRQVAVSIQPGMQADTDERLLELVLECLLDNAWKFTSRRPAANIAVGSGISPQGRPQWWVRDDGAGFDLPSAARLYQPFHRFHTDGEFGGIGAGLAIVQASLVRLGGSVRAEASPGQGATFYLTLGE